MKTATLVSYKRVGNGIGQTAGQNTQTKNPGTKSLGQKIPELIDVLLHNIKIFIMCYSKLLER